MFCFFVFNVWLGLCLEMYCLVLKLEKKDNMGTFFLVLFDALSIALLKTPTKAPYTQPN